MSSNIDKAQEALQEEAKPTIPPPAYQETSTTYIEPEGSEMVILQELEDDSQMAGPSTAPLEDAKPAETTPMPKEKGPEQPPRPAPTLPPDEAFAVEEKKPESVGEKKDVPVEEERDVLTALPLTLPSTEDKSLQVHSSGQQEETPPSLPKRPSAPRIAEDFSHDDSQFNLAPPVLPARPDSSREVPLKYIFTWTRPLLDFPTLDITPADNAIIPSAAPNLPPTAYWRLNYHKKYHARLHRYTAAQTDHNRNTAQAGDFPFRQIAEIKFPEFVLPGVGFGAIVKFETHEEELNRLGNQTTVRGKKPLPRVQKFLQCDGWLTTTYSMEVPVLDHLQTTWKTVPRPKNAKSGPGQADAATETAIVERRTTDIEREAKKQNIKLVTINDMIETAKRTLNNDTWTPYAPQQLVIESTGEVVATYQRASPFAKHAGVLTINETATEHPTSLPEFIEGIIIATTSMVGMQDRIGLASGLMEAASTSTKWSHEQWQRVQREWKDRKAKRQASSTHPYENTAARERSGLKGGGGEVGSEIFDDGLGGAISAEERQAARREQIAWDESARARSAGMDEGLAGVLSVEEMEAARREHLAWEEKNRTNVLSTPVSAPEPHHETKAWEEKPKVVYA